MAIIVPAGILVPNAFGGFAATLAGQGSSGAGSLVESSSSVAATCSSSSGLTDTNVAYCAAPLINADPLPTTGTVSSSVRLSNGGSLPSSYSSISPGSCGLLALADQVGNDTGVASGGLTTVQGGPFGSGSASTGFAGSSGNIQTVSEVTNPQNFAVAGWFETSTSGTILGFSGAQGVTGQYSNDRSLWIDHSGHLVFGIYPGKVVELTSPGSYDNGAWHFVVASVGPLGGGLWVDGQSVASNSSATTAQNYNGYWHIGWGAEDSTYWPDSPADPYFLGDLAGVAVFPSSLTGTENAALYSSSSWATYQARILTDGAQSFWPLNDLGLSNYNGNVAIGNAMSDLVDSVDTAAGLGSISYQQPGPISGSNSILTDGASGNLTTTGLISNPENFSLFGWFKTTLGGTIIGFSNSQGIIGQYNNDRSLWIDPSGRLVFGIYPNKVVELISPRSYNNGSWHFVVASVGPSGASLWVDGQSVASNSFVTTAQNYNGYWHIGWGAEDSTYWPDPPIKAYFAGNLSDVGVVSGVLSSADAFALENSATEGGFVTLAKSYGASQLWPLDDPYVNTLCSLVGVTIAVTESNGIASCVYPSSPSPCPQPSSAITLFSPGSESLSLPNLVPSASESLSFTIGELAPIPMDAIGLHLNVPITITQGNSGFKASVIYQTQEIVL
ncbi:MAG: LamG domain-containing protein [Acidimicrobiaceae bacterium]|nr:LamG domain-containing protein [Acidimicrobiaceae bacterium]